MALSLSANPHKNDKFYITLDDQTVEMTVCKHSSSGRVKLVFDAPSSVVIDRESVHLSKQNQG